MAIGAAVAIAAGHGLVWYAMRDPEPEPPEKLQAALRFLDAGKNAQASKLAKELDAIDYRLPGFSGAVKFILGVVAFRRAQACDDGESAARYRNAADYLREAERLALIEARNPEWAFALGVSLHKIGSAEEARELLRDAERAHPPGEMMARLYLADSYRHLRTPEGLKTALAYNTQLVSEDSLDPDLGDRAYLQRAHILLQSAQYAEAEETLSHLSSARAASQGAKVFRAQMAMAQGDHEAALQDLKPVSESTGLEQTHARQALFLTGVCFEHLGQIENAVAEFERTAQRYENTHEGLVAQLCAAKLLRQLNRNEEAIDAYRRVLQTVERPEDFHNPWLNLGEFRQAIVSAWTDWLEDASYAEAIKLSQLMTPLFAEIQAQRLTAQANQLWAESLEREFQEAPYSRRAALEGPLHRRWHSSGRAFAQLAVLVETTPEYPDVLWTSAEHFRQGHDFETALDQLTAFIQVRPKALLPIALVRRGQVLMDLDRLDEALEHFQQVIERYPTSPAAFAAQYSIGQCHLERDEVELARETWQSVLSMGPLEPSAKEWRSTLLALGRLLYNTACLMNDLRTEPDAAKAASGDRQTADEVFARWNEAIDRLGEFLQRYPDDPQVNEARYFLAQALKRRAEQPRQSLATAETDAVRLELRGRIRQLLDRSLAEWERLRSDLRELDEADRLDDFGHQILCDCYFEIAHVYSLLEDYPNAIVHYSIATNTYPKDSRIPLTYVKMAECCDRLGKKDEARSVLKQVNVILRQMPDEPLGSLPANANRQTNMNQQEWEQWIQWASRLREAAYDQPVEFQ